MKGKRRVTFAKSGLVRVMGYFQSGRDNIFYVARRPRPRQRKDTGKCLSLDFFARVT